MSDTEDKCYRILTDLDPKMAEEWRLEIMGRKAERRWQRIKGICSIGPRCTLSLQWPWPRSGYYKWPPEFGPLHEFRIGPFVIAWW